MLGIKASGNEQFIFFVSICVDSWFNQSKMKLSLLSILLGLGMGLPAGRWAHATGQALRRREKIPAQPRRSASLLMLFGTAWFVWNVNIEPIADFSAFKPYMMGGFIAVGVLSCIFVQDFLAVRGLAVVLLLLGKLMVDTGRPHLGQSPFVLVIQAWAYAFVVAGIWFTITPWQLRDFLNGPRPRNRARGS